MYNSYYNSLWGQYIIQIAQIGWQMSQIQLLLQLCPMKRAVKNCNRMERFLYQRHYVVIALLSAVSSARMRPWLIFVIPCGSRSVFNKPSLRHS